MQFETPLWLSLIAGLLVLLWFSLPRNQAGKRRWPTGNIAWLLVIRFLSLLGLVFCLAGPSLTLPSTRQDVILIIDVSDSQGPQLIEQSRQGALSLLAGLQADDRACLIAFGASAAVIAGPAKPGELAHQLATVELCCPDPSQSDYTAALQLAKRLADPTQGQPVWWLFGDGRATKGGGIGDLAGQLGNSRLFALPQGRAATSPASLALQVPQTLRAEEQAEISWQVISPRALDQKYKLIINGETIKEGVAELVAGENRVALQLPAISAGTHQLDLVPLTSSGAAMAESSVSAFLETDAAARILLATSGSGESPLTAILQTQGMKIDRVQANRLPAQVSAYEGIVAVILDNIPARELDNRQQAALQAYVASGGGLLVVGGDQSLGRGDYFSSALEELLPVQTDNRQRLLYNRTRILFVVDHSGSMTENISNTASKLDAAIQGVFLSLDQLANKDEIAVLTFDSEPSWVLEFTPVEQRPKIKAALAQLPTGGGTDMAKALEEVEASFGEPGPIHRHVVFLTDGETANTTKNFQAMSEHLATQGVSITTIGIGDTINADLLADIARWGNGTFYRAEGDQIPRIIKQDTVKLTRELIQEGNFPVIVTQAGDLASTLPAALPPISGYLITTLKPEASLILGVPNNTGSGPDPLLATWHYGSGQVAVFTADSGSRWLHAWSGNPSLNRLWGGMVRGLESGQRNQGLHMQLSVQASSVRVSLDAIDAERNLRNGLNLTGWMDGQAFALREVSPGHYEANLEIAGGLHRFKASDPVSGDWTSDWVWNPRLGENSQTEPDLPGLSALAQSTGGELRPIANPGQASRQTAWLPWPIVLPCLIISLLLLIVDLGMRSTLLGQFTMARAIIGEWWKNQRGQVDRSLRQTGPFTTEKTNDDHHKVMDAYRYLALSKQAKKHVAESVEKAEQETTNNTAKPL